MGKGGVNYPMEGRLIQSALNWLPQKQGGAAPRLKIDGIVGPKTIQAIRDFQFINLNFHDGRIDVNGKTLVALNKALLALPLPTVRIEL